MVRRVCTGLLVFVVLGLACRDGWDERARPGAAVAALGPSWLTRLGLSVESTALGGAGGRAPPAVAPVKEPTSSARGALAPGPFVLTGADIYRVSCRACHGPSGSGAPPEISSLVGPVQATSAALLRERTASAGGEASEAMIAELTRQAKASIDKRIAEGGQKMPAFGYLTEAERGALWEHLRALAGVPGAKEPTSRLSLSAERVGALVVRGTCHICHDATGPDHHEMMMYGIPPSLAWMRTRPFWMFAEKVERGQVSWMHGMRRRMGQPARMPAFPYLTRAEIAAAYAFVRK